MPNDKNDKNDKNVNHKTIKGMNSMSNHATLLSQLLLSPEESFAPDWNALSGESFDELTALASSNHVIVRAFQKLRARADSSQHPQILEQANVAIEKEQARIANALPQLHSICSTLEAEGCPVVVIKSLDHWPDLGSDLDLFSSAASEDVVRVMTQRFNAQVAPRSWGDRLANKWNFSLPGLAELVEIHIRRLGQTGEQVVVARQLVDRSGTREIAGYTFRVPAAEDRIMISTLQRMYRHFYLRLCDVVDMAGLLEFGHVRYTDLRATAERAGLWEGVAAYLVVVSDYVEQFRGQGIELPPSVIKMARFGGDEVHFKRGFLRIPIRPHAVGFYTSELKTLARNLEWRNLLRLSLLPCLATAAVIELRITGSDKGIW
jgi:hypothetical protein